MSVGACIGNVEIALRPYVSSGTLPGYVAAVSVAGERRIHAAGAMAIESGAGAMTEQTLFRVASLSKIVAAVLALGLEQDGVLALEDPVGRWLPELAEPRVLRDVSGPLDDTVAAARPIRVRDLLTMTAGMGRFVPDGPLHRAMVAQGMESGALPPAFSHDEFMKRLGADQLEPAQRAAAQRFFGERWSWGLGCQVKLNAGDTALAPGGFGWNGGKGTTAYVDRSRGLAGVLFTQRGLTGPRPTDFFVAFWDAVYRGL